MKATVEIGLTPDELFLQEAIRDGWAVRRDVPMQTIGNPDRSLQARVVGLDLIHVERLRESLQEFGALRPVVVFRDEASRKVWIADGFHRHEAYRLEGREMIPSFLVEGGYRGALKFATMCNRNNCLRRTKEDEKKAAYLLFGDEEWKRKGSVEISEHIGVAKRTIIKWRALYASETGDSLPEEIIDRNGRARPRTIETGRASIGKQHADGRYSKHVNGQKHYLGRDKETARAKLESLVIPHRSIYADSIKTILATNNIGCTGACNSPSSNLGECQLIIDGVIVYGKHDTATDLQALIARVLLNREKHHPDGRAIVVCYDPPQCEAIEISERLGVEFMTPEELVESLKGGA